MLLTLKGEMESSIIVTVITSITIFDGTNINDSGANNKNIDDNNSTIRIKIIIAGNLTTIKMITMITKTIKMSRGRSIFRGHLKLL